MSEFIGISELEAAFIGQDKKIIIGVDENGTGSATHPIVATAVVLNYDDLPTCVKDSKFFSSENFREEAYKELISKVPFYEVYYVPKRDAELIGQNDAIGYYARFKAVEKLMWKLFQNKLIPQVILIDRFDLREVDIEEQLPPDNYVLHTGSPTFKELLPNVDIRGVPDGDSKVLCIAAASIIGKVHRDEAMRKLHEIYPEYDLADNKGYVTKAHRAAIKKYGITEHHKKWFKDCANAPLNKKTVLSLPVSEPIKVAPQTEYIANLISYYNVLNKQDK